MLTAENGDAALIAETLKQAQRVGLAEEDLAALREMTERVRAEREALSPDSQPQTQPGTAPTTLPTEADNGEG